MWENTLLRLFQRTLKYPNSLLFKDIVPLNDTMKHARNPLFYRENNNQEFFGRAGRYPD